VRSSAADDRGRVDTQLRVSNIRYTLDLGRDLWSLEAD